MKRITAFATAVLLSVSASLWACDKEAKVASADAAASGCCKAKLQGEVARVMNTLPAMTYKVGDLETPCAKTAQSKACASHPVQYLVSGKAYTTESEATVALAELLEKQIGEMTQVRFAVGEQVYHCPMTAQAACTKDQKMTYRVAGFNFASMEQAQAAVQRATAAISDGAVLAAAQGADKPGCAKSGCGKAATASGEKKGGCSKSQAVVAGMQKDAGAEPADSTGSGCCKKAAGRLAATQEKIRTMVSVVAEAAMSAAS